VRSCASAIQAEGSLVESGLGVALVPSVSSRLASKKVVFRPIRGLPAAAGIAIALAYPARGEAAATKRFREVAAELPSD